MDGILASLVDLSYEGLRLEVRNAEAITLPSFFTLHVPAYEVACRVQRVWTGRPSTARDILWCGAVLPAPARTRRRRRPGAASSTLFPKAATTGDLLRVCARPVFSQPPPGSSRARLWQPAYCQSPTANSSSGPSGGG